MSGQQRSEEDKSVRTTSRRRVLQITALSIAGAGGLTSIGSAQQRTTDFGEVTVGSAQVKTITTENPADRSIKVTEVTVTGSDTGAFSITNGDAPFTLGPNESHTVRIRFAPTSTGGKTAKVRVDTARQSVVAGRLTGTCVQEGATGASNSSEDDTGSGESSASDSSNGSSSANASADEDSSNSSTPDESTRGSSTNNSSDSSSTEASAEDSASASQSAEPATNASSQESSSSGNTDNGATSDSTESRKASSSKSATRDMPEATENDLGPLITEFLDVDDDGAVTLQDFLIILRRLS